MKNKNGSTLSESSTKLHCTVCGKPIADLSLVQRINVPVFRNSDRTLIVGKNCEITSCSVCLDKYGSINITFDRPNETSLGFSKKLGIEIELKGSKPNN